MGVTHEFAQRIGFQGEAGAFGHLAAALAAPGAERVPFATFADVVSALRSGVVDAGVLPSENTIVGPIAASVQAFEESPHVIVVGAVSVPVQLCVLGLPGASVATIGELHSQDVALAQCGGFLRRYRHIVPVPAADTAGAARQIAERNDVRRAALASVNAAAIYGLTLLASDVQDDPTNATRFAVLTRRTR
jgi:prephenate dehydratase